MSTAAQTEPPFDRWAGSELLFDDDAHEYQLREPVARGAFAVRKLPSVTQILSFGKDTSRIPRWTGVFGTLVHKACEYDALGDLDESTLVAQEIDGRVCDPWPRLNAFRAWRKRDAPEIVATEQKLWGEIDGLLYAGTADLVVRMQPGDFDRNTLLVLLDIKTGQERPKEHGPQVWAYSVAYEQRTGTGIDGRGCLYLRDDGAKVEPHDDPAHLETFRVALHRWWDAQKENA